MTDAVEVCVMTDLVPGYSHNRHREKAKFDHSSSDLNVELKP